MTDVNISNIGPAAIWMAVLAGLFLTFIFVDQYRLLAGIGCLLWLVVGKFVFS